MAPPPMILWVILLFFMGRFFSMGGFIGWILLFLADSMGGFFFLRGLLGGFCFFSMGGLFSMGG